ncbi:MAG: efflux RND transporter periplasmic adaptor subunit [Gammaproteobacteria bacterium]
MTRRLGLLMAPLVLAATAAMADPSTAVTVQTVHMQKLAETITSYGRIVPNPGAIQQLSASKVGRITAVLVTQGTRVSRGQSLVRIEPTPQTLAAYESAKSDLSSAQAKLKQTQTLLKNGLATNADLSTAQSAAANAKSRLAALKAEGVGTHAQVMKAAAAGVVTQLAVSPGEWVNAGARIASLAPAGALWVRLGLTPGQAAGVKPGATVRLAPVFGPGKALTSQVAKVDAQADPTTGLIDAELSVPATRAGPFAGEWVAGTITLHSVNLPAVPRSAVLKNANANGFYVFVVRQGKAHRVSVKPVIRARGLVGLDGIKAGEVVVIQGNFELSDGAPVRITKAKDSGS